MVDAHFNIKGDGVDTNLFYADSPFRPYPTDFLYLTKSSDGGKTWSAPKLLDVKYEDEQSLLVGPGRGTVTSTGRIIFTVYDYTYADKFSAVIYSDDDGETWTRGADVSGWSSEAVVTEADGKLYMFTRHGNNYYISENGGETWGEPQKVTKPYIDTCQLSAITYSEKIDGKTAIILSAPSNTGSRAAGKLYVGLVQNDGSLDWKYEYSVNGSAYYAYSCLTELADGNLGLLYENDGTSITYKNISIEDVVAGATVGNIWFKEGESAVGNAVMAIGSTSTFTVEGLEANAELEVICSNEGIAAVSIDGNTITVTSTNSVDGLAIVTLTAKSGTTKNTLTIYVTDSENYEVVELAMGETVTYTDNTGNYGSNLVHDSNIAKVVTVGKDAERETGIAWIGNDAQYNGSSISLSECEYVFTSENGFEVSATAADGTKVYLQPQVHPAGTNNYPNAASNQANVIVSAGREENSFYLKAGDRFLHFYRDGKLYFDRVTTTSGFEAPCSFFLYRQAGADENGSTEISGYVQISSISEITADGKYLIVRPASDGSFYLLHPSNADNKYNYVAKINAPEPACTEITIEAEREGAAQVDVGGTTYFIFIKNKEQYITLKEGESVKLTGRVLHDAGDRDVVSVKENESSAPYEKVTSIESGKKYLMGNDTYLITNTEGSFEGEPNGLALQAVNYKRENSEQYLWTVTAVEGGYTVQDVNGKYFSFGDYNGYSSAIKLSDEMAVLQIGDSKKGGSYIKNTDGYFMNNYSSDSDNVAGYKSDDNPWYFYQPQGYVVTGISGSGNGDTTIVTIDGVNYFVTVIKEMPKVDKTALQTLYDANVSKEKGNYTDDSWASFTAALEEAKKVLDDNVTTQDEVDAMADALEKAVAALKEKTASQPNSGGESSDKEPVPEQKPSSGSSSSSDKGKEEDKKPVEVAPAPQPTIPSQPVIQSTTQTQKTAEATAESAVIAADAEKAEVSVKTLEKIVKEETGLTVEFEGVKVTFDADAVKAIAEQSKGNTVELRVVPVEHHELKEEQQAVLEKYDVAVRVSAQIFCDGEYIGDFKDGKAKIAIPFTPAEGRKAEHYNVYYVADNGEMTLVPSAYANGYMILETDHFSDYVIIYEGADAETENVQAAVEDEAVTEEVIVEEVQEEKSGFPLLPIIIGAAAVIAIAAFVVIKKKDDEK